MKAQIIAAGLRNLRQGQQEQEFLSKCFSVMDTFDLFFEFTHFSAFKLTLQKFQIFVHCKKT